jgi:predicted anti-sigma-YlaC factor YlaD
MPECRTIRNSLGRFFDGELSHTESRQIEDHLKQCSQCSLELQQIRELAGAFREAMPASPVAPDLTRRIVAKAHAQFENDLSGSNFPFWRNWSLSLRLAALGVASVACYIGLAIGSSSLPSTRSATAETRWIGMTSQEPIVKAYTGSVR